MRWFFFYAVDECISILSSAYDKDWTFVLLIDLQLAHIQYSNCFMCKCNSCSWQPECHISSVGIKIYNTPLKFQRDWTYKSEILHFKNHTFCIMEDKAPQYKMYKKIMILNIHVQ